MDASRIDAARQSGWLSYVVFLLLNRFTHWIDAPLAPPCFQEKALGAVMDHVHLRFDGESVAAILRAPKCTLLIHLQEVQQKVGDADAMVPGDPIPHAVHCSDCSVQAFGAHVLKLQQQLLWFQRRF